MRQAKRAVLFPARPPQEPLLWWIESTRHTACNCNEVSQCHVEGPMKIATFLLLVVTLTQAQQRHRDGNYWREQDRSGKLMYIIGLLDGINVGKEMVDTAFDRQTDAACIEKLNHAFSEMTSKTLSDVSSGQFADGLDTFYN